MTKKTFIIMTAAILGLFSCVARATLVPIAITGEVTYVYENYGLLGGNINVGDIITGVYIYDSSTPDSELAEDIGIYRHYAPPAGITLTVGGLVFMTNPDNTEFTVGIGNNPPPPLGGNPLDTYHLSSKYNLPLPNGAPVDHIWLSLSDLSFSTLSSDALPTSAPVLDDWETQRIEITGSIPAPREEYPEYRIEGDLTSAVLIPEPATVILFSLGSLALLRKGRSLEL